MGDQRYNDNALSIHTQEKVKKAKTMLETFYSNLVNQQIERDERSRKLEDFMEKEGLPDEMVFNNLFYTHLKTIMFLISLKRLMNNLFITTRGQFPRLTLNKM